MRDLFKVYREGPIETIALRGASVELSRGEVASLVGPSGSGKSTLIERERVRVRRERIGFLFQSDDLLPFLTAAENVGFQLALRGGPDVAGDGRRLLAELGLDEHADKLPDQLSGGQRQRVGIARALVHRPSLILADEPTGELDMASSEAVLDLLQAVRREVGATLIVVTHDPDVARRMDRTLRLRDGRLDGDGRPAQDGRRPRPPNDKNDKKEEEEERC